MDSDTVTLVCLNHSLVTPFYSCKFLNIRRMPCYLFFVEYKFGFDFYVAVNQLISAE
jgi:hypothetical protein